MNREVNREVNPSEHREQVRKLARLMLERGIAWDRVRIWLAKRGG